MKLRLFLLVAATVILAASTADAAGWKRLTTPDGQNIDQVGLLRTGDAVLHVAWHHQTGPNTVDLLHARITPSGTVGATTPIATGWLDIQNAAMVPVYGGIAVFFGGIRSTDPSDPDRDLNLGGSTDGGASWLVQNSPIVPIGAQAYGSPVSAAVLPDGTPLEAWAGTLGTWVHSGLDPRTPNYDYQAPLGHYGYDAGIAASAAGQAELAWYSNATGHLGVYAQGVAADGSPIGSAVGMPGTADMAVGMIGRTPIVARPGGGFFVAYASGYPAINRIRLWRVGGSSSATVARTKKTGNATATIAADPHGRLWVAWTNTVGSAPHVFARRSNKAATVFGAVVDAGRPPGASSFYRLDGSATATSLDLFGNVATGFSSTTATWYRRVIPGLTLSAAPARLRRGKEVDVTFTVLDAGDPVQGAKVKAGSESGTTNPQGHVTLGLLGRRRPVVAVASADGYVGASIRLRHR